MICRSNTRIADFHLDIIYRSRFFPSFEIERIHAVLHRHDTRCRIDFKQVLRRTVFNRILEVIPLIILRLDRTGLGLCRIFWYGEIYIVGIDKMRRFVVGILKLHQKATIELVAGNDGSIQVHNLEQHVLIAFNLKVFLYTDMRRIVRNGRHTVTLLDDNMLGFAILTEGHIIYVVFIGRIISQIIKRAK